MKRFTIIFLLFALFAFPAGVLADIAPPINPPGSNLQPGVDATQVRMVSEAVLINVNSDPTPGSLGSARITADFIMRNLGSSDESMPVRFPISVNDGRGQYPELTDLVIRVGGKQITYRRVSSLDAGYQNEAVPWAEFDVIFPTGQDVEIEVAYNLKGSGYMPYTAFFYILETGAGWKDSIGSADITLRLPYPASPQNIILKTQIGWGQTTPGGNIDGNEIHWHFEDFEPGPYEIVQNMEFVLVAPSVWQTVLMERNNVTQAPRDGEAWGRLAKAYKEIFLMNKGYREDAGGEELYDLSVEAYEKCLGLLPQDAQWHAGFADLLANRSYWDSFMKDPTPETYRALDEIRIALQIAPNDAIVQQIAQNIYYMFMDGISQNGTAYDFPWLTQTPTTLPPAPTIAPVYDPAIVAGIYRSGLLTLVTGKQAQLSLTLGTDHSATLESKRDDNQVIVSTGTWEDFGDGSIQVLVEDADMRETLLVFSLDGGHLRSIQYPAFYGEAGVDMQKLGTETATPEAPQTTVPEQPSALPAAPSPAPAPTSKPTSPLCGSAAFVTLLASWWVIRKRVA